MKKSIFIISAGIGSLLGIGIGIIQDVYNNNHKDPVDEETIVEDDKEIDGSMDERDAPWNKKTLSNLDEETTAQEVQPERNESTFEDIYYRLQNNEWVSYDDLTWYYASMEDYRSYKFSDPAINIQINSVLSSSNDQKQTMLFMDTEESASRLLIKEAEYEWRRRLDEDLRYFNKLDPEDVGDEPHLITAEQYGCEEYDADVVMYNLVTHQLTNPEGEPILRPDDAVGLDNLSFISQYPHLINSSIGLFVRSEADRTDYEIILIDQDLSSDE